MFDVYEILLAISPFVVIYLLWFCWKLNKRLGRLESLLAREHLSRFSKASEPDPVSADPTPAPAPATEPDSKPWSGSTALPTAAVPPDLPTRPFEFSGKEPAKGPAKEPAPIAASADTGTRDQSLSISPEHESSLESTLDSIGRVINWATGNWFHTTAAISLALAGILVTRYAADLIAPETRIAIALGLGAILIAAGEFLRRRFGDEPGRATAYLPSVFSGAGLITLFGAVLASRALYDLVGANAALGGLALVAALAVLFGWVYGPVLAVAGILGAVAAPFLVGGTPDHPSFLHGYFGLVAITGLLIHTIRHWRGFDALSVIAPVAAALFILYISGGEIAFMGLMFFLSLACPILANTDIIRDLPDRGVLFRMARLHLLTWYATVLLIPVCASSSESLEALLVGTVLLALMFLFAARWRMWVEPVIEMAMGAAVGLALLAALVLPALIELQKLQGNDRILAIIGIAGAAIFMSLVSALQSAEEENSRIRGWWAHGAAIMAPGILVILEIMLKPGEILGTSAWAGIAMGLAVLATLLAERAARFDAEDHLRPALGGLVALSMIALSLFASMQGVALSVALGVLTCAAALLDNRFRLPPLSGFVQAGIVVLLYRSVIDPGLFQAFEMNWGPVLVMYLVPCVLLNVALYAYHDIKRPVTWAALGSAVAVIGALTAMVIIMRLADRDVLFASRDSHAQMGVMASAWILSAWVNLYGAGFARVSKTGAVNKNMARSGAPQVLRFIAAIASLFMAFGFLGIGTTFFNPLFLPDSAIFGPLFINSMLPAYVLPGVLLLFAAWHLERMSRVLRWAAVACGSCLIFGYSCLTVAQAWRGANLASVRMGEGELWTYTILLLVIGVTLFSTAVERKSRTLRILANVAIVIAISKVFVVDAAELAGLVRAGSFLILGLVLAALAWVNRLVIVETDRADSTGSE